MDLPLDCCAAVSAASGRCLEACEESRRCCGCALCGFRGGTELVITFRKSELLLQVHTQGVGFWCLWSRKAQGWPGRGMREVTDEK